MTLLTDQISSIFKSFKAYLPDIRVDSKPINLFVSGFTKEGTDNDYPYFFIDKFDLKKNREIIHSRLKYQYSDILEDNDGKYAQKKSTPVPYKLLFPFEFVDSNKARYYKIKTELIKWFEKHQDITITYPNDIVEKDLIEVAPDSLENTISEVPHTIWTIKICFSLELDNDIELTRDIVEQIKLEDIEL